MDPRKLTKKNINKKSKETTYTSTQEASFHSCGQSNGSLLIHEENYEIFSDDISSAEIRDVDIPLEKRNLINDASYFKQLSLSFYGNPAPLQQKTVTQEDYRLNYKTEAIRMDNRSLSPSSGKDYFQALKKSPIITSENDHLQKTFNSFFKFIKANNFNSVNNTGSNSQSRGNITEKQVLRDNKNMNISRGNTREINLYKMNSSKLNNSLNRLTTMGMYPPLNSVMNGTGGLGVIGTGSPKNSSQIYKENTNSIKKVLRPSIKKVTPSKSKLISSKNYLSTEPCASDLRISASSHLIPSKLKMYAQDNLASFNLKSLVENNAKVHYNNVHKSSDKFLSIRPSVLNKSTQKISVQPKRTIIAAIPSKLVMKNGYFS